MRSFVIAAVCALMVLPGVAWAQESDTVGLVDPTSGLWVIRDGSGNELSFFFGNPGDVPFMGDWNCNGEATPGLYRQSDGFVYLRLTNTQGPADIEFFFGNPGDIPLAGDFNNDGCDTVSIYRQSEGKVYIINQLGQDQGGLGAAEFSYFFGNPGDKPFVGDFNGNGVDTVGLHRESTGFVYFRLDHTEGPAHVDYFYGDPGDRLVAGDWNGDGNDTPAIFRPSEGRFYFRNANTQGVADFEVQGGTSVHLPVAGKMGIGGTAFGTRAFGDGTWFVGTEIAPGTYRNSDSDSSLGCYWERRSGMSGSLADVIANEFTFLRTIVTIEPGDVGFLSDDCGEWTSDILPITSSTTAPFRDGLYVVGTDIAPGFWRNDDSSDGCYWERLSGFSHELKDLIANFFSTAIQTVKIESTDVGFLADRCGTWTKIG